MKKKKTQPKCCKIGCGQHVVLAQQLIGKCSKCSHVYCLAHRLPEVHECPGVQCVTQEEKDKLSASMRCVAPKI